MKADVMFLDCPAYMDEQGGTRCGLPAEVECLLVRSDSTAMDWEYLTVTVRQRWHVLSAMAEVRA